MVGEMRATDWARTVGKPSARDFSPWFLFPLDAPIGVGLVVSIVLTGLLLPSDVGTTAVVSLAFFV
jgi:hypothetical protein